MSIKIEQRDYLSMPELERLREQLCFRHLFEKRFAMRFMSVLEIFGGIGVLHDELLRLKLISPLTEYEAWEKSEHCVEILKQKYPTTKVRRVDTFVTPIPGDLDLLSADFNSWTILKYSQRLEYLKLTNKLFRSRAQYIQLTDTSVRQFHLHAEKYAKVLQRPITDLDSYILAISDRFHQQDGYTVIAAAYHHAACYMLFEKDDGAVFEPLASKFISLGKEIGKDKANAR